MSARRDTAAAPGPRRGALVRLALGFLATLVLFAALWAFAGERLVESAWHGGRGAFAAPLYLRDGARPTSLAVAQDVAAERVLGFLVAAASLWALGVALLVAARARLRWPLAVALLAATWIAIELVAAPYLVEPLKLSHYELVRDPDHRPRPGTRRGYNRDALRQAREAQEYVEERFNVVFLGDSFTMGLFVQPAEAFPALVERGLRRALPELDVQVANFGWTSSSPLLSLRRLRDIGARYSPDLVVLCLDMSDPHNDIVYANLLERRGICALYDRLPLALGLIESVAPSAFHALYDLSTGGNRPRHQYFATEMPLAESRPFLAPITANIDAIAAESAGLGAGFALFVLPRWFQYDERECPDDWEMQDPQRRHTVLGPYVLEPFVYFDELARERDWPIFSLLGDFVDDERFPTCLEHDPHWNATGHLVAAGAILRDLRPIVEALAAEQRGYSSSPK